MYSYEDRFKAVLLYLKLGKRLRATIRQLGYPTKNSHGQRLLSGAEPVGLEFRFVVDCGSGP